MEYFGILIFLLSGIFIGGSTTWLIIKTKIQQSYDKAKAETQADRASLVAQLIAKDQLIAELRDKLEKQNDELIAIRIDLRAESDRRSSAETSSSLIPALQNQLINKENSINQLNEHSRQLQGMLSTAQEKNSQIPKLEKELSEAREETGLLRASNLSFQTRLMESETTLQKEREAHQEKLALLAEAEQKLSDTFKALSAEVLNNNNQAFLHQASSTFRTLQEGAKGELELKQQAFANMVAPVKQALDKVEVQIQELEKSRTDAYAGLRQQISSLFESQNQLRTETSNLVKALRTPQVRGRWGEIQLKRVVEMAGMLDHCDFYEQQSFTGESGKLRPDMIVRLPADKQIVIDSKAPLDAYLNAIEAPDEETRKARLKDHAKQVRTHINTLSQKSYWSQLECTPEFVVLFIPGEIFFSAALEYDPTLIEAGVENNVILATPTTLIGLLRAVAYGWRQEKIAQNARQISVLGSDLYKRICDMNSHWQKLGKSVENVILNYNRAVSTLETRVLVTARKFKELETTSSNEQLELLLPLDHTTRKLQAPEMLPLPVFDGEVIEQND